MSGDAPKHETRDVDVKKVFYAGVVFFAIGFGALFGSRPIFNALAGATRQDELPTTPEPEVRAQRAVDPRTEMKAASGEEVRELRAQENEQLESLGWIDKGNGIAHVPVERAMAQIAERGLPARAAEAVPTATGTAARSKVPMGESNGFSEGGVP